MIDIVFQLVVFFMLSSTLVTRTTIDVALPVSGNAAEAVTAPLVVTVGVDGAVVVGDESASVGDLGAILPVAGADRGATVEADANVPYQMIVSVLDALRVAGYETINLAAERERADE